MHFGIHLDLTEFPIFLISALAYVVSDYMDPLLWACLQGVRAV